MSGFCMMETSFKIIGPNGTAVYTGTGRISQYLEVALNDAAAALAAEALIIDSGGTTVLGSPTVTAAVTESINAIRIVNGSSKGFLGVTLDAIRARTGATTIGMSTGRVAAAGSIVPVRTNGTFALNVNAISSSTAGQVTTGAVAAGTVLGLAVVANASVGGVNIGGVLVCPQ